MTVLCGSCKFYKVPGLFHTCSRWNYGYNPDDVPDDIQTRGIIVENDEGWGAEMGPEFGCVLGEVK